MNLSTFSAPEVERWPRFDLGLAVGVAFLAVLFPLPASCTLCAFVPCLLSSTATSEVRLESVFLESCTALADSFGCPAYGHWSPQGCFKAHGFLNM